MDQLTYGEEQLLEWQYCIQGGFTSALWMAIAKADINNLAKLSLGFPDEVEAYRRFCNEDGYWEGIQNKAKSLGWMKGMD